MSHPNHAEELRANRADSLGRRPHLNPLGSTSTTAGQFKGRTVLKAACVLEIGRIIPDPDQPRKTFDPGLIENMADSIKTRGQLVPAIVRWSESLGLYVIIDGEQRYRACIEADVQAMTCVVWDNIEQADLLEVQLIANALRSDVLPVEQAKAYRALIDAKGYTHRDLADRLNLAHTTITRALGLLELSPALQAQVDDGKISARAGYEIARIDDPGERAEVAARVVDEGLSQAKTVEVVKQAKAKTARAGGATSKGRGAKSTPKLPTERTVKLDGGFKVIVSGRKGFDQATLVELLKDALEREMAKLEPAEQGGDSAAA
jgi:ParB family transcriptional regulator, chromosome partitioning protein